MPDNVIRIGGDVIRDASSFKNFIHYVRLKQGRNYLVISAVSGIREILGNALTNVFSADPDQISSQLRSLFHEFTGGESSPGYAGFSEQIRNILRGIALTGDYSEALRDQLNSYSEKLTVEIIKVLLQEQGIAVSVLWPEEIGLTVTPDYGNATFLSVDMESLRRNEEGIFLIPGSYGITGRGKTARSGKTAADYTAAFLTRFLGAEKLQLWGLDHAFQRADPRIVPDAPRIGRLTYSEASELAYFDHYSFHPRTVEPLEEKHIPIVVLDTGTSEGIVDTVINTEAYVEKQIVKAVACSDDISLLRLNGPGVGLKPGILAKVTSGLNDAGVNIKSVITSQISIHLILEKNAGDRAFKIMKNSAFSSVREISVVKDISLIGVVGHGMQQNYGVSARIFSAVSENKINVLLSGSGASDLVSYLVVQEEDKARGVGAIYRAFFGEEPSGFTGKVHNVSGNDL